MKRIFMVGALAMALLALPAVASAAQGDLKLKPSAGSCNGTGVGNGQNSQAQWTNKQAKSGKFSVLLQKSAATENCSFAAIVVKGVEGSSVASLGQLGFDVKGYCGAGSPRFNLFYDNNGDGQYDGYAFYGCAAHAGPADANGWRNMTVNSATPDFVVGAPAAPTATVVQLAVLSDEQGTSYVDNVTAAGQTAGEPNGD
jgi:hypothetical protein